MKPVDIDLMNALKTMNSANVIDLLSKNKSKTCNFSFAGYMKKLSEEDLKNLWKLLTEMVIKLGDEAFDPLASKKAEDKSNKAYQKLLDEAQQVIVAAIDITSAGFEMKLPIAIETYHFAIYLNALLSNIPSNFEGLKNNIAQFCEKMYQHSVTKERCHFFLYNAIIHLLTRSLAPKATKSDVKRVYMLRKEFPGILTVQYIKRTELLELFKRCASSKLYLQTSEGFKIISLSLMLDVDFIPEIHEVIKSQLQRCTLETAISFGKAYFDAWSNAVKNSKEDFKKVLQYSCIENILRLGIEGQNKSVVINVRKFLSQFHRNKKETYVMDMLYNLFQPILWRFLRSHDGRIRSNAAELYLDAFPFADPDARIVQSDLHLNDQLLMIKDLLLDDYPIVRCSAIIGLCISMSVNWELFPEEMLATYFRIIVDDLSRDSSSSEVRCAVAKGVKVLLENPLTYTTLQRVLPKLQGLFHDVSEPVRIAFCQLLLRVKKIPAIKYFDIVPPNHLLARMEDDCHAVCKAIVDLLSNSYFPRDGCPQMCLIRCIELIKMDHSASRIFFRYITSFISLETTVNFIIQGVKAVHFYMTLKLKADKSCALKPNPEIKAQKEKFIELEKATNFNNMDTVKGVFDSVAIMWISSERKLVQPSNKNFLKLLVGNLKKYLPDLLIYYKDSSVAGSLYYFSSYMPICDVQNLSSLCFSQLKKLPDDAKPEEFVSFLESLCNQKSSRELLQMLHEWINYGINNITSVPAKKKRGSNRKSTPVCESEAKPYLATQMLSSLLDHRACQKSLLDTCPDILIDMLKSIDVIKEKIEQINVNSYNEKNALVLKEFLLSLLKISVLLHAEDKYNSIEYVENIISWCEKALLQHCNVNEVKEKSKGKRKKKTDNQKNPNSFSQIALQICRDVCITSSDMASLGYFNVKKCSCLKFTFKLLYLESAPLFLFTICKILNKHSFYGMVLVSTNEDYTLLNMVPSYIAEIIECVKKPTFVEEIPAGEKKDIQLILSNLNQTVYEQKKLSKDAFKLAKLVVECTLNSFIESSSKIVEERNCNPFKEIFVPSPGAFLYSTITVKPKTILLYVKALRELYTQNEVKVDSFIAYWLIVWNILEVKSVPPKAFTEISHLLKAMKESLKTICSSENVPLQGSSGSGKVENLHSKDLCFKNHCKAEFSSLENVFNKKSTD